MIGTYSTGKGECCGDYLVAARAGHTQCLQSLAEAGRFLPLGNPNRAAAGEFRKLEFWQAAITTCRAGHRPTLSWLLASGWPSSIDPLLLWQTRDTVNLHHLMERGDLVEKDSLISDACKSEKPFLVELDLYRHAMRKATPECLEALLEAGCRSVWICRLAALEGNAACLALAAAWGCPCDLIALRFAAYSGDLTLLMAAYSAARLPNGELCAGVGKLSEAQSKHISHAVQFAASKGHAACLVALVGWFEKSIVGLGLADTVAVKGDLNSLQTLHRAGCLDVVKAVHGAALKAQLECLKYLLDLDPALVHQPFLAILLCLNEAKPETQVSSLECLLHHGFQWSADGHQISAADSQGVLRYCLERLPVKAWDSAMLFSVKRGSPESMQLLYDAGYEQHRSREPSRHPAVYVVEQVMYLPRRTARECLSLAVSRSGVPDVRHLDTACAVQWGEDILRYVREAGVPFTIETTNAAARKGNVGALRYALENRAPWDATTFAAVITFSCRPSRVNTEMCPDWLECLRCLHEHSRAAGLPDKCGGPSEGAFAGPSWGDSPGPSLAVLRYVCDDVGPAWATPLLESTAKKLIGWVVENEGWRSHQVDWQMVLYLGRKLKQGLPAPLCELVAVRRERAAALAGVFFKAGRLAQGRCHPRMLARCGAMARLPLELRERIASQAHLIYREAPCQPQAS
eukprot:jgi/Botrbrau1/5229/Bobra.0172s0092.1